MTLSWWQKLLRRQYRRSPFARLGDPAGRRFRPRLEQLEDRLAPATFTVSNTNDAGSGSLRDAITQANAAATNDDIVFTIGAGSTITLASALPAIVTAATGGTLTITGLGAANLRVSANGGNFRPFTINAGAVVTITGMTISGANITTANTDGGGIHNSGSLALDDVTVAANTTTRHGGGIFNNNNASLAITNSTIGPTTNFGGLAGNTAGSTGGGIRNNGAGSLLTLVNSSVSGNTVTGGNFDGGGIYNNTGATLNVSGGAISNNTLGNNNSAYGAGLFNAGTAAIDGCNIDGNLGPADNSNNSRGGGIFNNTNGSLNLTNSTLRNNRTTRFGGGIFNQGGAVNFSNVVITGNTLTPTANGGSADTDGAGIFNNFGSMTLASCDISGNLANGIDADGGGIEMRGGTMILNNCTVNNNLAGDNGGGIRIINSGGYLANFQMTGGSVSNNTLSQDNGIGAGVRLDHLGGTAAFTNVTITQNIAPLRGGGIVTNNGTLTLDGCTISQNEARGRQNNTDARGGGIWIASGIVNIRNCLIQNNTAIDTVFNAGGDDAFGGGIFSENAFVTIDNTQITGNVVTSSVNGLDAQGGGIRNTADLTITNSVIANNILNGDLCRGGGVWSQRNLTMTNVVVDNNQINDTNTAGNSSAGAGIWFQSGIVPDTATLTNVTVTRNTMTAADNNDGGGIHHNSGTMTLINSSIGGLPGQGNTAGDRGGGIFSTGILIMIGCTVADNTAGPQADAEGGGVWSNNNLTMSNCTVSGNRLTGSGDSDGSGVHIEGGPAVLTNVTITQNVGSTVVGSTSGGGLARDGGTVTLRNTIVAGNIATTSANPDLDGTFDAANSFNNFIGNGTGGNLTNGVNGNQVGTAAAPLNPLLGPLQNNGGPTLTHALLAGSPCINTGNNNSSPGATDQRGFNRIVNFIIDIGAYEFQPPIVNITLTSDRNPSTFGQTVCFTAVLSTPVPGGNTPTGVVFFYVDGVFVASVNVTGGAAVFCTAGIAVGSHTVTAVYQGDPNFPSVQMSLVQTVLSAGVPFIITGTDVGAPPHVKVYNTVTRSFIFSFYAYSTAFTGGVRVAMGDVNGDAFPDLITVPGVGGGSEVKVFDGRTGQLIRWFFAHPGLTTGFYIAAADVNGDRIDDIVVGTDAGTAARVRVFDGASTTQIWDVFAFGSFFGGVRVAAADVNGDGFADVICGAGQGSLVRVYSRGIAVQDFYAFGAFGGGVYVAGGDVTGDGLADVIVGAGAGGQPLVNLFVGGVLQRSFLAYPAAFAGGVRVGAVRDLGGGTSAEVLTAPGDQNNILQHGTTVGGTNLAGTLTEQVFDGLSLALLDAFFAYPGYAGGVFIAGSR